MPDAVEVLEVAVYTKQGRKILMGRIVPQEVRDPFEQLPLGILGLRCTGAAEAMIGQENPKYSIAVSFVTVEPAKAEGISHTENFLIGTDEDPGDLEHSVSDETWTKRGGRLKKLCEAMDVPFMGQPIEVVCSTLVDRDVLAHVTGSIEPAVRRDGAPNPYAGRTRSNVRAWFKVGERECTVDDAATAELQARAQAFAEGSAAGPRPATVGNGQAGPAQPRAPQPLRSGPAATAPRMAAAAPQAPAAVRTPTSTPGPRRLGARA